MTIDEAIKELVTQRQGLQERIDDYRSSILAIDGEIRGLERARDLFAAEEAAPGRLDIQRPIMAAFARTGPDATWVEAGLVQETDLPRLAVRKFLNRAVRDGKLVCDEGVYSLPPAPTARAAE